MALTIDPGQAPSDMGREAPLSPHESDPYIIPGIGEAITQTELDQLGDDELKRSRIQAEVDALFPREAISDMATNLLEREDIHPEGRFVMVTLQGESEYADLGRFVEHQVFGVEYLNTPRELRSEYTIPYDRASLMVVVLDTENENLPVGCLRLMAHDEENGIKSFRDAASDRWDWHEDMEGRARERMGDDFDENRTFDAGTLSVLEGYRDGLVSSALYHGGIALSEEANINLWAMMIDRRAKNAIQRHYAEPLEDVGLEEAEYLGSKNTMPMILDVPAYLDRIRDDRPDLYAIIHDGQSELFELPGNNFDFRYFHDVIE